MARAGDRGESSSDASGPDRPPEWRILVVDDDERAAENCKYALSGVRGYSVKTELLPLNVQKVAREWNPDLIILDVTMPRLDGFELARRLIADQCSASLMFITSHTERDYEVDGIALAEDFIVKPYDVQVLLARVWNILKRRSHKPDMRPMSRGRERSRPIIDQRSRFVRVPHGRDATLTSIEMRLLMTLLDHADHVVSYDDLLRLCWDIEPGDDDDKAKDTLQRRSYHQLVQTNISRLRGKIELNPEQPELIITIPRVGYSYVLRADRP